MFRRSFGLVAALLFVLCVGLATMWAREEPRLPLPPPPPPPSAPPPLPMMSPLPLGVSAQGLRQRQLQLQIQQIQLQLSARSSPPLLDLSKPMPPLPPFRGSQLRDVLDWLSGLDAGSIEANWPAIEAAGIQPVTLVPGEAAPGGTFGSALADVLAPMGLAFASDGHFVYVSAAADVERFGHMRHVGRFAFTTRADTITAAALESEQRVRFATPLANWFGPLGRQLGVQFEPDWQTIRASGANVQTPSAWQSHEAAVTVLDATLREASANEPLRYQIQGGKVVISTAAAFESAERRRIRLVVFSTIGVVIAFSAVMILARRRPGLRRWLCVALVLLAAGAVSVPIWRARPDAVSARLGRSRWTVGLAPGRSFVLWKTPKQLEDVFMAHRSRGPARVVYFDRHGFYAASEGAPYQVFSARAPRWAAIALLGALPFIWLASNVPAVFKLPRRLRERRRARAGRCMRCGYDLRGCPSGRCPECGDVAP